MTENKAKRYRSAGVAIGSAAVLSIALAGCSSDDSESDYAEVCVDQATQQRVDDADCDENSSSYRPGLFAWFYMSRLGGSGGLVPPIGSRINSSTGSYAKPPGGASVSRGGFGSRGGGSGSLGG